VVWAFLGISLADAHDVECAGESRGTWRRQSAILRVKHRMVLPKSASGGEDWAHVDRLTRLVLFNLTLKLSSQPWRLRWILPG
jgi:hypothetical protein